MMAVTASVLIVGVDGDTNGGFILKLVFTLSMSVVMASIIVAIYAIICSGATVCYTGGTRSGRPLYLEYP
jgi:hypothetical protein